MADKNVFSKYSLDNILEEAKTYSGENSNSKIWSLDEIDALLAGEDYNKINTDNDAAENSEAEETAPEDRFELTISQEEDITFAEKEETEAAASDEGFHRAFDSEDSVDFDNGASAIDEEIKNSGFSLNLSDIKEDDTGFQELYSSLKDEEKSPSVNLKEAAIKNTIDKKDMGFEVLPETPMVEGTVPDLGKKDYVDNELNDENPPQNISGQISIEKTRVFNEVDARAVHNEGIHHNIGNKVIHTSVGGEKIPGGRGIETDKYREKFLNKPKLDVEKTRDHERLASSKPPKTFEKYGVIVKKPNDEKTSEDGLMPMPTIVAAEDELKNINQREFNLQTGDVKSPALGDAAKDEIIPNQIKLDGFESEDRPEVVDDYEAEMDLISRRRERAGKFKLFPNLPSDGETSDSRLEETDYANEKTKFNILGDIQDEELEDEDEFDEEYEEEEKPRKKRRKRESGESVGEIRIAREYYSPKDAHAVLDIMLSKGKKTKLKTTILLIMGIVLAAADLFVSFSNNYQIFGGSTAAFIGVNLACLLIAAIIEYEEIGDLFKSMASKKTGRSAIVCATLFAGMLQSAVALGYTSGVNNGIHIYAPIVFLPLVLISLGDIIKNKNDIENFEYLTKNANNLYSVSKIDDDGMAFEIGRGLLMGDPDIRYSAKIAFPSKFVEMTKRSIPENDLIKLAAPAVFIAAIVIAAVTGFVSKNVLSAVSAFTGVILLGLPVASVLSSATILRSSNKALLDYNSFVSGYNAVDDAIKANAVVIDASDLFLYGGCNIYGIKPLHSMRIDDAILYTAAVIIQSGGTLSDVFDRIILSKREILPPVESLAYEDKLGCSGWINDQRVLVGNRELLSKHNVEVPSKEEEEKYKIDGKQILYLAVEGKTAALFVVGYKPNDNTGKYLNLLEKCGVSVLVRTTDPNITESMIEQYFDLPRNFVKIINPVAGKYYKEIYDTEKPNDDCKIMHDGSVNTLLRSFLSAFSIYDKIKISTVLQCIGIGIGILVEALLAFTSGLSQAGVLQILVFEIVWTLLVIFIPKLKRI